MTIEELATKVEQLERRLQEIEAFVHASPSAQTAQTFGMFANDIGFEENVRLGREYRDQANKDVDE